MDCADRSGPDLPDAIEISMARAVEDLPERFNAAADLLDHNLVAGRGGKIAVIDHRGGTTYGELADRVDRMARVFRTLGIGRGQRVLLCLLDTVDFPTVFLGAIKAGVVPVPLNTRLPPDDYRWILANSLAKAVVLSAETSQHWSDVAATFPDVRFISDGDGPGLKLDELLAAAPPLRAAANTHRDEAAFWLYTSGSTGRPKGVMHAHSAMRLTANLFARGVVGYREDDIVLSVAKQFFAYGLGNALTFPYAVGATVVLHKDRATPRAIGALMRIHRVTLLNGVPTFFAGWLASGEAPTKAEVPDLRLATSAGECLPAHLGEAFRARYGVDVIDGLGSTEMLHVYLGQRPDAARYGCTGRPVPGYELRIVDAAGAIAGVDELGELHVRGPTAALGYWLNRSKTDATFRGGWVRTGDNYRRDAEGWYFYGGRGDDMLKVSGLYVSPTEVEDVLLRNEHVLEAAVIGAPDDDGLVKPRAHVVLKPGQCGDRAMEAILKAYVKPRLASYKVPRWIVFTDALPRTVSGKIQRFRLREQAGLSSS